MAAITERPLVVTHACAAALVAASRATSPTRSSTRCASPAAWSASASTTSSRPRRTDIARHVDYIADADRAASTSRSAPTSTAASCPAGIRGAQDLPLVLDDLRRWASRTAARATSFLRVLRQPQNAASSRARPTGSS